MNRVRGNLSPVVINVVLYEIFIVENIVLKIRNLS
jgi:hypothetical protein